MEIDKTLDFIAAGLVLAGLGLIEDEKGKEQGGSEEEISARIEIMSDEEILDGVRVGLLLRSNKEDMFDGGITSNPRIDFFNEN